MFSLRRLAARLLSTREVSDNPLSHADYNVIFRSTVVDEMPVERMRLTELYVPTGEIVATDPLVVPDLKPFTRRVPPGTDPVDLYIAQTPQSGPRIAIAVLTFCEGTAARFELALKEGETLNELEKPGDFFGFPVDAGLGAFYDQQTSILYRKFTDEFYAKSPDGNIYDDFFADKFKANALNPDDPNDVGNWLDFHLPDSPMHNIAMFSSGYGDGVYPAYWGIGADGKLVNLVIDFHVLLLPDENGS